jgi:hypothetical protein
MALPLDLFAEVTTASGTRYKWDANQPPGSRLQNLSFRTKIGEGFSDASGQLARRIDQDYPDLNLVDTVTFTGADGSVAYEGRVSSMPRDLGDRHSIGVTLAGWMAHAKDRKFTDIYVDRDQSQWTDMSTARRAARVLANFSPTSPTSLQDVANGQGAVETGFDGAWVSPYVPISEAWYDAGPGVTITAVWYTWKRNGFGSAVPYNWFVGYAADDAGSGEYTSSSLVAAGPSSSSFSVIGAAQRYAFLMAYYNGTPAGADGAHWGVLWYNLAVYGTANIAVHVGDPNQPPGFYASDVIKDIAGRWCPQLDTSGVQGTTYVVQHIAFRDRTFPYDAFLELNKYHLYRLAVWENKRLEFGPYDLTDYNWEIRTDDPGTTFAPQGPSTESLFNGITVTYTDHLSGVVSTLTPVDDVTLADRSTDNPWNQHGVNHWDEITLSSRTDRATALALGQAALADRNRPKTPGTITVRGYIRDRQGNDKPVWKVRAGDTISVTNFPNDTPRLVVETDYDDETKTISLAIDKPFALLDAYLDRQANALQAAGLA